MTLVVEKEESTNSLIFGGGFEKALVVSNRRLMKNSIVRFRQA